LPEDSRDVSVEVETAEPIVVERPTYFNHNGLTGGHVSLGATSPSAVSSFAEGFISSDFREYITVMNPSEVTAKVDLELMMGYGNTERNYEVKPRSRITICLNESKVIGFSKYCDAVGFHIFELPGKWSGVYSNLRELMNRNCLPEHISEPEHTCELAVTSCGWGHGKLASTKYYEPVEEFGDPGDPSKHHILDYHNEQAQKEAIGDRGIGSLTRQGCKKVWVFKDLDDHVAGYDGYYLGLFSYPSHKPHVPYPNNAWWEYVKHQKSGYFPDYKDKE
jgi:hypothetical protein